MKHIVLVQIIRDSRKYPVICWWDNEHKNKIINIAHKLGWVRRHSVSQVEWTERGINETR